VTRVVSYSIDNENRHENCADRPARRERSSKALWWDREGRLLARGGVGRAGTRRNAFRERRLSDDRKTDPDMAAGNSVEPTTAGPVCTARSTAGGGGPHFDLDWVHLPLLSRMNVPFLTTLHGRLDLAYLATMVRTFPDARFVSISESQRKPLPGLNWLRTVHHGLPAGLFEVSLQSAGYLAFLGRIAPEKGPDVAIRLAKASGLPLRIAAKISREENRYFKQQIEPYIDDKEIAFIGEVDERRKATLLGGAAALLFPINWPEPFGLVMIEAMARGTPVIAWRRGSVPEIIEDGVTGFIVETEAEALTAIRRIGQLDRGRIRQRFDQRFTAHRMAKDYCDLYHGLILRRRPEERLRLYRRLRLHLLRSRRDQLPESLRSVRYRRRLSRRCRRRHEPCP